MKRKNSHSDPFVRKIIDVLKKQYATQHSKAQIDAYRYNSASIRIRIVDPDFEGLDLVERDELVWPFLGTLPESIRADISMLLLLTPKENKRPLVSLEFDDRQKSGL
jgi:stress-induced morphogen